MRSKRGSCEAAECIADSCKLREGALAGVSRGTPPAGDSDAKRRRKQPREPAADAEQPAEALELTTVPRGGSFSDDEAAQAEVDELNNAQ